MTNEEKARTLSLQDHLTNDDYALCPSNDTIIRLNAYGAAMKMAEWKDEKACASFCKVCDTKECQDYGSDTCNWLQKFKKALNK